MSSPSKLTSLFVGYGLGGLATVAVAAVTAAVVNGSVVTGGDVVLLTTPNNPRTEIQVSNSGDLITMMTLSGSRTRSGGITISRPLNYAQNGYQTGVSLKAGNVTQYQRFCVPCTSTGGDLQISKGGSVYDTCALRSPLTSTATVIRFDYESRLDPFAIVAYGSFVKALKTGTGTAWPNFRGKSTGTGGNSYFSTGGLRWNPADIAKIGTLTTLPRNQAYAAQLCATILDDTSE